MHRLIPMKPVARERASARTRGPVPAGPAPPRPLPQDLATPDYVIERTKLPRARRLRHQYRPAAGQGRRPEAARAGRGAGRQLRRDRSTSSKVEIAGPGFINFTISQPCRLATMRRVFEQGADYGRQAAGIARVGDGGVRLGQSRTARCTSATAAAPPTAPRSPTCSRPPATRCSASTTSTTPAGRWTSSRSACGCATTSWAASTCASPTTATRATTCPRSRARLRAKEGDRLRHSAIEITDGLPPTRARAATRNCTSTR